MRIHRLTLTNFYGFEDLTVELDPELTVLIGPNGAGKSTVLEGLAVALGAWLGGFAGIKEDFVFAKSSARLVRAESEGLATMEAQYPVRVEASGVAQGSHVQWARELRGVRGRTTHGEAGRVRELAADAEASLAGTGLDLPVISYYGTGRLWLQRRDRKRDQEQLASRLMGYRSALDSASDPKHFEAWMRWRTEEKIQRIARAQEQGSPLADVQSPHLDAVQRAACECLDGASRFYYSANHKELRVEWGDGIEMPFHGLSDGQRNLLAVAADIAWRAAQLNPHHGVDAAAKATGIVLIDEVDLHLHPAWQRRVIDDLRRTFPRVQFVVTTHSPQVVSTVPRQAVRALDGGPLAHTVGRVQGRDTNTILEQTFGVPARPRDVQRRLDELAELVDRNEPGEAKARLAELQSELGSDDPELIAAQWEIDAAEALDAAD